MTKPIKEELDLEDLVKEVDEPSERLVLSGKNSNCSITLSAYVYQRMRYLVDNMDAEIAWLGTVTKKANNFQINEIYVPTQEVTASSVDANPEMMSGLIPELIEKHGKEEALTKIIPNMRAFCHSHHTMKTFWSATDEAGINGLANSHYLISLVLNRDGDILGRIDFFKPNRMTITDVKVDICYNAVFDDLEKDIEDKVTKKTFAIQHVSQQSRGYTPYQQQSGFYGNWNNPMNNSAKELGLVSIKALPDLISKKEKRFKNLVSMVKKFEKKEKPKHLRDLAMLIFASNFENNTLDSNKKNLQAVLKELGRNQEETLSSEAVFEIITVADTFGVVKGVDPAKQIKSGSAKSLMNILQYQYKVNAEDTTCVGP